MILSDLLNGYAYNGHVHFVVFTNSRIQQCIEKDTPYIDWCFPLMEALIKSP